MTTPSKRSKASAHDANAADSELPEQQLSRGTSSDAEASEASEASEAQPRVEMVKRKRAPVTGELPALTPPPELGRQRVVDQESEGEATLFRSVPSRPKKTTLAMAIVKPTPPPPSPPPPAEPGHSIESARDSQSAAGVGKLPEALPGSTYPPVAPSPEEVPLDLVDEVDEWSIADQPTVYLSPNLSPNNLLTRRPQLPGSAKAPTPPFDQDLTLLQRRVSNTPGTTSANAGTSANTLSRQPAPPDGRLRPATSPGRPGGSSSGPAAQPDPHMQRFQHLREGRLAHQEGGRGPNEARPVAEIVGKWWRDLRPGLDTALRYQREARASGSHPIPAYEPSPGSRLGDAFGRLAASARGMTGRAQSAMGPKINRLQELHAHAESAASAFVEKLESPVTRQQAPLLGPGRIAVFFKQGVTVGQAQSLLGASRARPIRLIPRKHGFLALVAPGTEAEISARLREHPYIRDVAYLEYNEFGEANQPR